MSQAEIIVEVSPEGQMIGPVERDKAHSEEIPHAIVMIFLFDGDDLVQDRNTTLLQRRSLTKKQYPGFLTAAASGHVQYQKEKTLKELADISAKEELTQELGPEFSDIDLLFWGQLFVSVPGETQLVLLYLGVSHHQQPALEDGEVEGVVTATFDQVVAFAERGEVTPFALAAMKMLGIIPQQLTPHYS